MREYLFKGKALTLWQPWASAIAFAGKDIENRPGRTHYRGPLAIHAGKTLVLDDLTQLRRGAKGARKRPLIDLIKAGRRRYRCAPEEYAETSQIVAIAMVVDCVESCSSPWWDREQFGWVISGVVPIEPIHYKGARGLWPCRFKYRPLRPR